MNKEIQKKWVEALRSGNYHQGQEMLYREEHEDWQENFDGTVTDEWVEVPESYCCLGVLCEITDPAWQAWFADNDLDLAVTTLSENAENKSGLDDGEIRDALADLNDNGYSFEQIATFIEGTNLDSPVLFDIKQELVHRIRGGESASNVSVKEVIDAVTREG